MHNFRAKKSKAVQKRTISRWIALFSEICYGLAKKLVPEGLRIHSTRAKSISTEIVHIVPVLGICQAATCASLHTFTKHCSLVSQVLWDGVHPICTAGFPVLSHFTDPPLERCCFDICSKGEGIYSPKSLSEQQIIYLWKHLFW